MSTEPTKFTLEDARKKLATIRTYLNEQAGKPKMNPFLWATKNNFGVLEEAAKLGKLNDEQLAAISKFPVTPDVRVLPDEPPKPNITTKVK